MEGILFYIGVVSLIALLCIGIAYIVHIIIEIDSTKITMLAYIISIIIAIALMVIGLKLGINKINV